LDKLLSISLLNHYLSILMTTLSGTTIAISGDAAIGGTLSVANLAVGGAISATAIAMGGALSTDNVVVAGNVVVGDTLLATTDNTQNIGSTTERFATLHANDMYLGGDVQSLQYVRA
jgi:heptaprenylglyceryl phosphate synthase